MNVHTAQSSQSANTSFKAEPLRFYGNTEVGESAESRMKNVFGGRLAGGERLASSRRDVGKPRKIAGVLVPDRPKEPDNCCMSGCATCVWEQFNDDIRDWRRTRKEAANKLNKTEELWPADFNPPLKELEFKNVPRELRAVKRKMAKGNKKLSSSAYFPAAGKPGAQNLKRKEEEEREADADAKEEDEGWDGVPVQFKAFAEAEKRIKERKLQKQKQKELEASKALESS
ncbi:Oxidoreductase-like domain-containing protein 1 [Cyberlindnera fabianii]|uniref:Oxidoreductase-like domain-containing protein 1 n=1 Tax=Cyberlindnera fabianii TaxID=36022 RepID=A0A1V2L7Z5_CYBFA|nr:Oxidoreductase-like domain-containing protein 1 [Cyberlindnera fabianii]